MNAIENSRQLAVVKWARAIGVKALKRERRLKLFGMALGMALGAWPQWARCQTTTMLMPPGAIQLNGDPTDTTLDWGIWWNATGMATEVYDSTVSSSPDIPGSIHVTFTLPGAAANPGAGANLCFGDFIAPNIGNNNWLGVDESSAVDFSQYSALSFDILLNTTTSSNTDIPIFLFSWNYDAQQIGSVPIPTTIGWQHVSIPIPDTFSFDDTNAPPPNGTAWGFYEWYPNTPPACGDFWIDNVQLVGAGYIPPPKLLPPVRSEPGLNVFATTTNNSAWDRQQAFLLLTNGLSWVGNASAAHPVSYSFGVGGFPSGAADIAYNTEGNLFMVPNPAAMDNAPDWDETNVVAVRLQSTGNGGGQVQFQYKVNEPGNQEMLFGDSPYTNAPGSWNGATPNYLESGLLAQVQSATLFGTWTIRFTSSTNVALIAPDGTTTNFVFPPYNVGCFAETNGFNIYLGMEANTTNALNQAVVYSSFAVSNVASACSDNFLADTSLNLNLWTTASATGPPGVLVVPTNAPYWIRWTVPAENFSLVDSASVGATANWFAVSSHAPVTMLNGQQQLVNTSDLPAGQEAFFALVKRSPTQLLVVFPGETNAPNTPTGKEGTPYPVDLISSNGMVVFTVLAVDARFYPVSGDNDSVEITSSDPSGFVIGPNPTALNNGSAQVLYVFGTPGEQGVTVMDLTNPNIASGSDTNIDVVNQ